MAPPLPLLAREYPQSPSGSPHPRSGINKTSCWHLSVPAGLATPGAPVALVHIASTPDEGIRPAHWHSLPHCWCCPLITAYMPPPPQPLTTFQLPRRKLFHFYCDFPSLSTPAVFNPAVTQHSTIFSRGLGRPELGELDPRQIVIKAKNNERRTKAGVISRAGAIFRPVLFLLLLLLRVSLENCSRATREGRERNRKKKNCG